MIVLSQALVLEAQVASIPADNPIIGWHNIVTAGGIEADGAAVGYPASNLAQPTTHEIWKGANTSDQYLTIAGDIDPIDYIGIAGHNFASGDIVVSIEGYISGSWVEIFEETLLARDDSVILRFEPLSLSQVRLKLQPDSVIPRAATVYCGKLLEMQRAIYVGHTPLTDARKTKLYTGASESGNFLGRIVLSEMRQSPARFRLLDPDWFRANMRTFLAQARTLPFFFAWRPSTYPEEGGYAWLMNDPMPSPDDQSHMIEVELVMQGVP